MIYSSIPSDQESDHQRHPGRIRRRRRSRQPLQIRCGDGRERTRRQRLRRPLGRIHDSSAEEARLVEDFRPGPVREEGRQVRAQVGRLVSLPEVSLVVLVRW